MIDGFGANPRLNAIKADDLMKNLPNRGYSRNSKRRFRHHVTTGVCIVYCAPGVRYRTRIEFGTIPIDTETNRYDFDILFIEAFVQCQYKCHGDARGWGGKNLVNRKSDTSKRSSTISNTGCTAHQTPTSMIALHNQSS